MSWQNVAALAIALLALAGTLATLFVGRDREAWERQNTRMDRLEQELAKQRNHSRIQDDYIFALRQHIADGKPPPPPPWPTELYHSTMRNLP